MLVIHVRIENTQQYPVGRVQSLCGCEGGRQSDEGQNKKMFFFMYACNV